MDRKLQLIFVILFVIQITQSVPLPEAKKRAAYSDESDGYSDESEDSKNDSNYGAHYEDQREIDYEPEYGDEEMEPEVTNEITIEMVEGNDYSEVEAEPQNVDGSNGSKKENDVKLGGKPVNINTQENIIQVGGASGGKGKGGTGSGGIKHEGKVVVENDQKDGASIPGGTEKGKGSGIKNEKPEVDSKPTTKPQGGVKNDKKDAGPGGKVKNEEKNDKNVKKESKPTNDGKIDVKQQDADGKKGGAASAEADSKPVKGGVKNDATPTDTVGKGKEVGASGKGDAKKKETKLPGKDGGNENDTKDAKKTDKEGTGQPPTTPKNDDEQRTVGTTIRSNVVPCGQPNGEVKIEPESVVESEPLESVTDKLNPVTVMSTSATKIDNATPVISITPTGIENNKPKPNAPPTPTATPINEIRPGVPTNPTIIDNKPIESLDKLKVDEETSAEDDCEDECDEDDCEDECDEGEETATNPMLDPSAISKPIPSIPLVVRNPDLEPEESSEECGDMCDGKKVETDSVSVTPLPVESIPGVHIPKEPVTYEPVPTAPVKIGEMPLNICNIGTPDVERRSGQTSGGCECQNNALALAKQVIDVQRQLLSLYKLVSTEYPASVGDDFSYDV